ncbi:MipA/OmpV family protein [Acerihabitans sp. TG2]|uniref:MipA/OmpV family protein n=1 Tax=Acerihabitans sp. TG2 TaxID=3096008 RepID=UPI002B22578B|nr:MipA/OmpV family protein [Acerihabitans sp. TG2]MEA9390247.1 MipA/OmpV family protein [Acerihabitans sp. TG2]
MTKFDKNYTPLAVLLSLGLIQNAAADDLSLGAAVGIKTSPYKGANTKASPLPFINYDSQYFFIHGLGAGIHLYKDDHNEFNVIGEYSPMGFKSGDTDDSQLKKLNKRKSTIMAGMSYIHRDIWGVIHADVMRDTSGDSNGMTSDVGYSYRFEWNKFEFTPGVGVLWSSKKQNEYYYGISQSESLRSGLNAYDPNDSISPYVQMSLDYPFATDWKASISARYSVLSSQVKNSPMVDKSGVSSLGIGINYSF